HPEGIGETNREGGSEGDRARTRPTSEVSGLGSGSFSARGEGSAAAKSSATHMQHRVAPVLRRGRPCPWVVRLLTDCGRQPEPFPHPDGQTAPNKAPISKIEFTTLCTSGSGACVG